MGLLEFLHYGRFPKNSRKTNPQGARSMSVESLESRQMLAADVIITELMYHPSDSIDEDFEYVELYNAGDMSQSLSEWQFTDGSAANDVMYEFTQNYTLLPGEFVVIAANTTKFISKYGSIVNLVGNTSGWTNGKLSNGGETVYLLDDDQSISNAIAKISYDDANGGWPASPDGEGSSLQLEVEDAMAETDITRRYRRANWIASLELDGSPGKAGLLVIPKIVINEVLANSDDLAGETDKIELHNPTEDSIDIGGWWVTDKTEANDIDTTHYEIPAGTTIGPYGYFTIDETEFNPTVGPLAFALSSGGETLSLLEVDGSFILFVDTVTMGRSSQSISWGRFPNGKGVLFPTAVQTFGAENILHKTSPIVISEIMYHPDGFGTSDLERENEKNSEYIEFFNQSAGAPINLTNWRLAGDVDLSFPAKLLNAGERMLLMRFDPFLAANSAKRIAFEARYGITLSEDGGLGTVMAIGGYGEIVTKPGVSLSNSIATLKLQEKDLNEGTTHWVLRDLVNYRDGSNGWPSAPDGRGLSLERPDANSYSNNPDSWTPSLAWRGTPGSEPLGTPDVVINEIVAHTDPPNFVDSIELYNRSTTTSYNIGGWWLSDSSSLFEKFQLPPNTILAPGEYITFNEDHFDSGDLPVTRRFVMSSDSGETIWLLQNDGGGSPERLDRVRFGASFSNDALGRVDFDSAQLHRLAESTLPARFDTNPGPGDPYLDGENAPLVITQPVDVASANHIIVSEIMYNPGGTTPNDFEFVEIYNRSQSNFSLGPVESGEGWLRFPQGWRLDNGIDFEFTLSDVIPAGGTIVVVSFDPDVETAKAASFRAHYGIDNSVLLAGPFEKGKHLSDFGSQVQLEAPDAARSLLLPEDKFTPNILVDQVIYSNLSPWPVSAAGTGNSLTRTAPDTFGDDPVNWIAAAATPGSTLFSVPVIGDANGDGLVNKLDFDVLVSNYAKTGAAVSDGDFSGDSVVGLADLMLLQQIIDATTVITSAAQLQRISENLFGNYRLGSDIDVTETAAWNGGLGFDPIGDSGTPFMGSFDGNGHTIAGLSINRPAEDFVGLFGAVRDASIHDLGLTDVDITGSQSVGALAGSVSGTSTISETFVSGNLHAEKSTAGGMLGGLFGTATLRDSYSGVDVESESANVGGLVGSTSAGSLIENSYATGSVVSTSNTIGGLVGFLVGTLRNSFATGTVVGNSPVQNIGGLVGWFFAPSSIDNSYRAGSVVNSSGSINALGLTASPASLMQIDHAVFSNWDFDTPVWLESAGQFPRLAWQGTSGGAGGSPIAPSDQLVSTSLELELRLERLGSESTDDSLSQTVSKSSESATTLTDSDFVRSRFDRTLSALRSLRLRSVKAHRSLRSFEQVVTESDLDLLAKSIINQRNS